MSEVAMTYINTTCKVGQSEPCGRAAIWVIAVTEVADTAWATERRSGGVVGLCEYHATTPVSDWRLGEIAERAAFTCNAPDCNKNPGHMGAHR